MLSVYKNVKFNIIKVTLLVLKNSNLKTWK